MATTSTAVWWAFRGNEICTSTKTVNEGGLGNMIRKSLKRQRGFTLIELMIVVAIIGILAVLAIYGVSRYLKSAKTAEASNNIGALQKQATEALTREKMSGAYTVSYTHLRAHETPEHLV